MRNLSDNELPLCRSTVICIGNFDGLHCGHRQLIKKTVEIAAEKNLCSLMWTFQDHPIKSLNPSVNLEYIISRKEKSDTVAQMGIDLIYNADFLRFKDYSADDFADNILCEMFSADTVVCGYNFSYGKDGRGNAETLQRKLAEKNVKTVIIQPVSVNGNIISSTLIRKLIANGDMETAAVMLGKNYGFELPVVYGAARGRNMGFPTLNQRLPDDAVKPLFGVYAVECIVGDTVYKGVADVGVKPTFGGTDIPFCETHLFGFNGDLYGKKVRIVFYKLLRPEYRFDDSEQLIAAIKKDVASAKDYFGI